MRGFDTLTSCCCKGAREDDLSTFDKVATAVKGLTGAEVEASTLLMDCGLDSFGTGALLGSLRLVFRGSNLSPVQLYQLETIQDLVDEIDRDLRSKDKASENDRLESAV